MAIAMLRVSLRRRHQRDLDPDCHALEFTLGHREGSDGNPAKRLYIKKITALWIKEQMRDLASTPNFYKEKPQGSFIGYLTMFFSAGEALTVHERPLHRMDPGVEATIGQSWADWITHLRIASTTGAVVADDPEAGGEKKSGIMRAEGKYWTWTRMPDEMAATITSRPLMFLGPQPEVDLRALYRS